MKIINKTISYSFKNLPILFVFACIPACFIGGLLNPFKITNFLLNYKNLNVKNFLSILQPLFETNWMSIINSILAFILLVMVMSAILGIIQNHFRTGEKVYNQINSYLNNNILIVGFYFLLTIISFLIFKFILALAFFALHIIFSGLGTVPTLLNYILVIVFCVLSLYAFTFWLTILIVAIPETITTGYSVKTSLSNATELLNKNYLKTSLQILLPFLIIIPLVVASYFLGFSVIFNTFSFLLAFIYYPVLSLTCYFAYSNQERKDIKIKHYFK